jgi:RDD family
VVSHRALAPGCDTYVILTFAGLGAIVGASPANPLGFRIGYGIHGALVGAAVGVPCWAFFRWHQGMEAEAEEERVEALAGHEELVTPVRLPTWNRRFVARVLDTLLLVGAGLLLEVATGANWMLVALVLWPLYDIVLHAGFGATAGKALCRICVVDAGGAARVGVLRAAGRWALLVVNVPFIWLQVAVSGDLLWSIDSLAGHHRSVERCRRPNSTRRRMIARTEGRVGGGSQGAWPRTKAVRTSSMVARSSGESRAMRSSA